MLEIRGLKAFYGDNIVFENVNMNISEREVVSFIGPSGGGKSTLLNCINRFIIEKGGNYEGEIKLKGIETSKMDIGELRHRVCTVFQDSKPFPISIEKNIHYVLDYYGVKNKREKTEELLTSVGLFDEVKDKLKEPASSLSGGQKQRLCIARALACTPEIILLDEPSASLDPANTKIIEDLIIKLSKNHTILLVTHNIEQAERVSDKIFRIGE